MREGYGERATEGAPARSLPVKQSQDIVCGGGGRSWTVAILKIGNYQGGVNLCGPSIDCGPTGPGFESCWMTEDSVMGAVMR